MKSLQSKTLTQFTLCTAAILVLTAPLFYLLTKWFYAEDMIDIIEAVERGEGIPPLDLERAIMAGMMLQFLLILAKIDNAQYTVTEKVDAGAMLSCSLPFYGVLRKDTPLHVDDRRGGRGINCGRDSKPISNTIRANSVLLECLLKNLIVNAIRNSSSGSVVNIILEDDSLTVCNVSEDGRPLDAATLFRRFRSGDMKKKGNGLGLAIVKSVCDFHGWTVSYGFDDGCHCFTVRFRGDR